MQSALSQVAPAYRAKFVGRQAFKCGLVRHVACETWRWRLPHSQNIGAKARKAED